VLHLERDIVHLLAATDGDAAPGEGGAPARELHPRTGTRAACAHGNRAHGIARALGDLRDSVSMNTVSRRTAAGGNE